MPFQDLIAKLGEEIEDPEEETFLLFSQSIPSQNLGFVDAKATNLELTISGRDLSITQSPGLLSSDRQGGTTGAVVWKITPLFAEWMTSRNNPFFNTSVLHEHSQVVELGCGISGIIALCLSPKIGKYIATDQDYVFKLLKSNIIENTVGQIIPAKVNIVALDWELHSVSNLSKILENDSTTKAFQDIDVIIACDCIYNEALISPLVQTCAETCQLAQRAPRGTPTTCIIAQQLRSDSVFEAWLMAFHALFRVWRVPDCLLIEGLREGSGFVVHVGILREDGRRE